MRHRHALSDADWERIKHLLPGQPGQPGQVAQDNRRFRDAVLGIAKTGAPWRDRPDRFGPWNSAWRRFDRWASKGVWLSIFETLRDPDLEWLILDSTVVRAHSDAAGQTGGHPTRRWAAPAAGSGPSFPSPSTGSATRSSSPRPAAKRPT